MTDLRGDQNAPARETICAVIITQNHDSGFFSRLEKVKPQVAQIVIVDNGSTGLCAGQLRQLKEQGAVQLIWNQTNEGIARALNQGAQWAAQRGYHWILTLDQDTVVAPDMVNALAAVYEAFPDQHSLAVIGSNYTNSVNGKVAVREKSRVSPGAREVKAVITSGSLVPLRVLGEIGGFREEFFVDCVDVEYCLRARARGFRVARTSAPLMQHSVGRLSEHRLFWTVLGTTNHSPWRRYFQARNTLILAREYLGREPALVLGALGSRGRAILHVCLFEKQRLRKIAYSMLGVVDGLRGKMNRFSIRSEVFADRDQTS